MPYDIIPILSSIVITNYSHSLYRILGSTPPAREAIDRLDLEMKSFKIDRVTGVRTK